MPDGRTRSDIRRFWTVGFTPVQKHHRLFHLAFYRIWYSSEWVTEAKSIVSIAHPPEYIFFSFIHLLMCSRGTNDKHAVCLVVTTTKKDCLHNLEAEYTMISTRVNIKSYSKFCDDGLSNGISVLSDIFIYYARMAERKDIARFRRMTDGIMLHQRQKERE